jgi:hypothetical protein
MHLVGVDGIYAFLPTIPLGVYIFFRLVNKEMPQCIIRPYNSARIQFEYKNTRVEHYDIKNKEISYYINVRG